jgi:hypothetical protein
MTIEENIGEVWISGRDEGQAVLAQPRLEYVESLMWRRTATLQGEGEAARYVGQAFRVHVTEIAGLLALPVCRTAMEIIARNGERLGAVLLLHAPTLDEVSAAITEAGSTHLAAALIEGRAVRYVPYTGAPGLMRPAAETAVEALLQAARAVSACDPFDIAAVLDRTFAGDSPAARATVAFSLQVAVGLITPAPAPAPDAPARTRAVSTPARDRFDPAPVPPPRERWTA